MDAKDIRNLQEAYLEVYQEQELDEARKKVKIETNKPVEYKIADIGPGKKEYNVKTSKGWKEEVDLYDIILSHLLDEGYAETPKAAEAIMVNMSEEWRDSIVEEVLDENLISQAASGVGYVAGAAQNAAERKVRNVVGGARAAAGGFKSGYEKARSGPSVGPTVGTRSTVGSKNIKPNLTGKPTGSNRGREFTTPPS